MSTHVNVNVDKTKKESPQKPEHPLSRLASLHALGGRFQ